MPLETRVENRLELSEERMFHGEFNFYPSQSIQTSEITPSVLVVLSLMILRSLTGMTVDVIDFQFVAMRRDRAA